MRTRTARRTLRPRLAVPLVVAGMVLAVAGLAAAPSGSDGRPPSPATSLPADAFRPVPPPEDTMPDLATTSGAATEGQRRDPDPAPWRDEVPGPAPTPEPSPPGGPIHVVERGDSLWQIAVWHQSSLELIIRWNPGVDARRLVAGQRILVPGGAPMPDRRAVVRAPAAEVPAGHSTLVWPLPVGGTITTRFSASHKGIDIAAPAGTEVRAVAAGTVVRAGWRTTGGGCVVEILHPDGMRSRYNHNSVVTVSVGQAVDAGETVALVGATGWATGPHLDLRIEMDGRLVDPPRFY